jgi:hypothetical protein
MNGKNLIEPVAGSLPRRSFVTRAGIFGLSAAAAAFLPGTPVRADQSDFGDADNLSGDTAQEIFTAALIAEDLASTFYYNGLTGPVITDLNLAGPGGSATNVTSGDAGNVGYFRAALGEEITHANLLRALIGKSSSTTDPVQTFYLPSSAFETIGGFTGLLDALENAFIGAYLTATIEFAQMAVDAKGFGRRQRDAFGKPYKTTDLEYFAQVAASIMGVEAEHRVLGRDVSGMIPANNRNYELQDGILSVFNGKQSAVVALTPFLAPGPGLTAYSLQDALANASKVALPVQGAPPTPPVVPKNRDHDW